VSINRVPDDVAVERLAAHWRVFADTSCGRYSPLYDRISRAVIDDREVLSVLARAPRDAQQAVLVLAVVHFLLLGGLEHPLADVYVGRTDADPAALFRDLVLTNADAVVDLLTTRRTQTNEVGRSAVLGPALTVVADRLGAPLALIDAGSSAGLNLRCDRYRLDYGEHGATGPAAAPVRIACHVVAGTPPVAPALPAIAGRVGIDRAPVDLDDADAARWLLACTWPDTGRLARTQRAIADARTDRPEVVAGDLFEELPLVLDRLPAHATACVFTTWVLAYSRREGRQAFVDLVRDAGTRRPVAWISAEDPVVLPQFHATELQLPDHDGTRPSLLGLTVCDGDRFDATILGYVHPHGLWMDWRGQGAQESPP
jgi:hypothetical protein